MIDNPFNLTTDSENYLYKVSKSAVETLAIENWTQIFPWLQTWIFPPKLQSEVFKIYQNVRLRFDSFFAGIRTGTVQNSQQMLLVLFQIHFQRLFSP